MFFALPFLSGVDLFIPRGHAASGTAGRAQVARGRAARKVNVPNFASSTDAVSVNLDD